MAKRAVTSTSRGIKTRLLDESKLPADPFSLFLVWFKDAVKKNEPEPEAMFLATAGASGRPSGRLVLLKYVDAQGFVFFTSYTSRKGKEMEENPSVAAAFRWTGPDRQVRIEGKVMKTTGEESDEYFRSRPEGSRLSAAASPQSKEIPGREWLELKRNEIEKRYAGKEIPRPETWGGYRIIPDRIEFWQGREHRFHDRIVYRKMRGGWKILRLAP
jgi:pyridoxamine 5'-phosphate oxidase